MQNNIYTLSHSFTQEKPYKSNTTNNKNNKKTFFMRMMTTRCDVVQSVYKSETHRGCKVSVFVYLHLCKHNAHGGALLLTQPQTSRTLCHNEFSFCEIFFILGKNILSKNFRMQNIMPVSDASESDSLYYGQFPHDFKFGTSTVAEQVEGTWNGDGKGLSVWDEFSQSHPKCIADRSTSKEACDSYRGFEDDVILLKNMHANTYSFTLNWARLCPDGTCHNVNEKGVEYYDDLINTLVENGIEPIVTLYHTDMPQTLLQNHAGGWMNESLISEFESFARLCFERFGDRIQHWVTIAQPWVHSWKSYGDGTHPPSICLGTNGASLALGNLLKAHSRVCQMYEDEFRRIQNGRVGISLRVKDEEDEGCLFQLERVLSPIVAERRPKCCTNTDETWASSSSTQNFDFLAIQFSPGPSSSESSLTMLKLLRTVKENFGNPKVLVFCEGPQLECPSAQVMDTDRAQYFSQVANQVLRGMDLDECNVEGFFPGKLMDCWEFENGFSISYGLHHVNFAHPSKRRSPRASVAFMLKQLFKLKHFEHADVI